MSLLREVEVRWASLQEPNTKFNPVWEVEALLEPAQVAHFEKLGCNVKTGKEGERFIRFKKKVSGQKKDGTIYENFPPKVVDVYKQPFNQLIGNGSVCNISYKDIPYEAFGGGVALRLEAVQVVKHKSYSGSGSDGTDEFDVVEAQTDSVDEDDLPF